MYDRRPGFFRTEEDAATGRRVAGTVKWFSAAKGFGFVAPGDGSADAFLPMACLRRAGYGEAREGAAIVCDVAAGAKGPLVVNVLSIDNGTGLASRAGATRAARTLEGAVRWFEPAKGYGFVSPDGGGKDVFVHASALRRSGLTALGPGQRVRMDVVDGTRGREADRVTVL